jgi:nanoRNase/pAp phosphatase (c-di-AMP/oligoRNAs hydrolase)
MNTTTNPLIRCADAIQKGSLGGIFLPKKPTLDAVAAATSLYLALSKLGKTVSISCATPVQYDVIACDKIQNTVGSNGDNLVVSFPYTDGSIDKVDYNIQGNLFNLVITPRQGHQKLDPSQVNYSYSGGSLDFIITIDTPTLQNLDTIYTENQQLFQGKEIINVDRHLTNGFYGTVNLVQKTASSISELVLPILQQLKIEMDKDIATNLYMGIATATNNFTSYSVNAETFETVAALLRNGAIKKRTQPQSFTQTTPKQIPQQFSQPFETQNQKPIEVLEKESGPEKQPTPQDWLKPKIFRSGGLI